MLEPWIRPQRAQERVLERVLGAVAAEPPAEEAQDLGAVLLVERLERGNRGCHRYVKRTSAPNCEV